jgi:hypothetical protein
MVETRGLMNMFGANGSGKSMYSTSNAEPFDKKGES